MMTDIWPKVISSLQVLASGDHGFDRMGLLHGAAGKAKVRHLGLKATKNCTTSNRAGLKLRYLRGSMAGRLCRLACGFPVGFE